MSTIIACFSQTLLTVFRFLFSAQSAPGGYLQDADVNASLASMCIRYLCSGCFDTDLSDDVLRKHIMSGAYVLEGYACLYWLRHVKQAGAAQNRDLLGDLNQLMAVRRNMSFSEDVVSSTKELDRFKDTAPDLFNSLIQADTFARRRWREFCLSEGKFDGSHFDISRNFPAGANEKACRRSKRLGAF
jgi:hypothetical protein